MSSPVSHFLSIGLLSLHFYVPRTLFSKVPSLNTNIPSLSFRRFWQRGWNGPAWRGIATLFTSIYTNHKQPLVENGNENTRIALKRSVDGFIRVYQCIWKTFSGHKPHNQNQQIWEQILQQEQNLHAPLTGVLPVMKWSCSDMQNYHQTPS